MENAEPTDKLLQMKPFLTRFNYKRYWIWLKRFRHRKGYGVHSPFAFDFITRIIYNKVSSETRKRLYAEAIKAGRSESRKVIELLYRLEQEASPFVYVNRPDDPIYINKVYDEQAASMPSKGMFVVYGIYRNQGMKEVWQQLMHDERSGITFDLYELGVILFDKNITKQDYIVNF